MHTCFIATGCSIGGNVLCIYEVRNVNELSERLYYIKVLQDQALEKEASTGYSRLYDSFKHNFNFLMKYANSLFAQKRYDEAITVLKRANLVSCHPNIYNLLGQCYQASGNFVDAEKCYKVSTQLLPIRIYPYYLLAKLYAEPAFRQPDKFETMKRIVLTKEPKVQSTAIKEMREELNKIHIY